MSWSWNCRNSLIPLKLVFPAAAFNPQASGGEAVPPPSARGHPPDGNDEAMSIRSSRKDGRTGQQPDQPRDDPVCFFPQQPATNMACTEGLK